MAQIKARRVQDAGDVNQDTNVNLSMEKATITAVNLYKKVNSGYGKQTAIAKIAELANMAVGGETELLIKALKGL